jgi:hypothetical protein
MGLPSPLQSPPANPLPDLNAYLTHLEHTEVCSSQLRGILRSESGNEGCREVWDGQEFLLRVCCDGRDGGCWERRWRC